MIFPVLDGLDELPEHLRRRALSRINSTLAGNRRILLTCRSVEYAEGIAAGAPALRQCPVFEVIPLTAGQITRHLATNPLWTPVGGVISKDPAGPLGIALSTPLMLSLFTRAYAERDPADLLTLTSGDDVRDHLVDVLIDSVYPEQGKRWTAAKARGYLTYLAQYLHQHAERELNWWKLPNRVLSPWTGALVGLVGGGVVMTILAPLNIDDPTYVLESPYLSAGVFTLFCTASWFLGLGHRADQWRPGFRRGARAGALLVLVPAAISVVIGLATDRFGVRRDGAVVTGLVVEAAAGYVCGMAALAAVCALAVGLHGHLIARSAVVGRAEPADILRRERRATLLGAATTLLVAGALSAGVWIGATAVGEHLGQRVATALGIPVVIRPIGDGIPELDAEEVTKKAVLTLVVAALLVVAVLLTSRWPRYVVAKVLLWATGQLPLRLERFLADARDKGLLRAGAAGYEFWHVALQERLVVRSKNVRKRRPVVRAAAFWLAAATIVSAVVMIDLTQPDACASTGLPHADATLFTVVGAAGTSACAAKLDTTDVAKLLGGVPEAEAEKALTLGSGPAILGQFSDMDPATFREVAEGIQFGFGANTAHELYTLPHNIPASGAAIPLLRSTIEMPHAAALSRSGESVFLVGENPGMPSYELGSAGFLLQSDGSVLITSEGKAPQTMTDPVEIALAAIENVGGPRSRLSGEAVSDGVDDAECALLQEEEFKKSIDLRGKAFDLDAVHTLTECGVASVVVDYDMPVDVRNETLAVWYVTDAAMETAHICQQAFPSPEDSSAAACTVAQLTSHIYASADLSVVAYE